MRARDLWLVPAGLVIGLVGAMCGIGGGLFTVPLLHYVRRLELRVAVATALCLVLSTSCAATITEALRADSAIRWPLVAVLVPAALAGAQVGWVVSKRLSARILKALFAVVLAIAGARLLAGSTGVTPAEAASVPLGGAEYAWGALVGFGGGFVAPLLGIGGGLLVVPGLFLGLPELGFAGARACSLAVAVATATRSLWLYAREGSVRRAPGVALGAGAFAGAGLGVVLLHQPGWIDVGRSALGLLLLFVAARFAWDVARARARSS